MATRNDLDCAFVGDDAVVHAVLRAMPNATALCGNTPVAVRIDAPFRADDDLACARCAATAVRPPLAG
jgi:hypothetical protein